jgi:hypothetical protein
MTTNLTGSSDHDILSTMGEGLMTENKEIVEKKTRKRKAATTLPPTEDSSTIESKILDLTTITSLNPDATATTTSVAVGPAGQSVTITPSAPNVSSSSPNIVIDEEYVSPLKRRNTNSSTTSSTTSSSSSPYKAHEVIMSLIFELNDVKKEIIEVDNILHNLVCIQQKPFSSILSPINTITTVQHADESFSILLPSTSTTTTTIYSHANANKNNKISDFLTFLWKQSELAKTEQDTPISFVTPLTVSRVISRISSEYLRVYQQVFDAFEHARLAAIRDAYDRYRRRWENWTSFLLHHHTTTANNNNNSNNSNVKALLFHPSNGNKISLQGIPFVCDRIPNPFGR